MTIERVMAWLLHPAPIISVPAAALVAIAIVAALMWTGGFIVRGRMQSTPLALMAGMTCLQYAIMASLFALLANPLTLRCIATVSLILYVSFFLRQARLLGAREPEVVLFFQDFGTFRTSGTRLWMIVQAVLMIQLSVIFVWPDPRVVAWTCVVMMFAGFRMMLAFAYGDLRGSRTQP